MISREVIGIIVAYTDISTLVGEFGIPNDITLFAHRRIHFVMGIDQPPTTPFRNSHKTDWATCKTELNARVTIHGRGIKSIAGIEQTASMKEAFKESYLLKMPKKDETQWWNSNSPKQMGTASDSKLQITE